MGQFLLLEVSSDSRTFEVESAVYIAMRGEKVVHDNEMDLATIGYLNAMKAIKL
jgi:hypothetical protein